MVQGRARGGLGSFFLSERRSIVSAARGRRGAWPAARDHGMRRFVLVRLKGLEPSRRFQRYHLKVVRLPIPPQPQFRPSDLEIARAYGDAQIREDADVSERSPERKRQIAGQRPPPVNGQDSHIYNE